MDKKWEYLVVDLDSEIKRERLNNALHLCDEVKELGPEGTMNWHMEMLDRYGAKGWELVQLSSGGQLLTIAVMKREKP